MSASTSSNHSKPSNSRVNIVYYDLKATAMKFSRNPKGGGHVEIAEIGAMCLTRTFHRYLVPTREIDRDATNKHGLSKRGKHIHHRSRGEIWMYAVTPTKGLNDFIRWLKEVKEETKSSKLILCSYNNRKFTSMILMKNLDFFKILPDTDNDRETFEFADALDITKELKSKDSNLRSVCLSDSLSYLCQIQIRPDHVHDALSDARYVSFICEEASNKLGYEDYDNYVTDHKSKLWTSFDTVADLQSVRKSSLE